MEAIRNDKNEIQYRYPEDNPYAERGNQNVGFVEYRMPSLGIVVFAPLPDTENFFEDCVELWGEFCTPLKIATAFTRKTLNDWDNKVPGMVKAWEEEGLSEQEIVQKIQEYVAEYNVAVPQVAKSSKDKTDAKEYRALLGSLPEGMTKEDLLAAAAALKEQG